MNKNKRTRSNLDIVYTILDFARLILITVVAAMVILVFVARKEEVRGTSMYPTLVEGESVIINMAANYVGEIKRFDVVVAREYRSEDLWVKRVIGLPGETISYREDVLYVDGKAMEEPFLDKKYVEQVKKSANKLYFTQDYTSKKLGKNEYLLVGDNRNESLDSRNDAVGPFQREQIIARGVFVYQPFSKARYVGNGG
ncbi:signal peptidase I [Erysipelotrichaceae bacterium I46]|uniref:signal peptidase I n=1 Tax=Clostridium innocuum TaxID=1522 RepID=UPI00080C7BAC|nr:signal peptidase I [[Clostridium] innocuum]ANU69553.1 signal peptidase I [Erysipelotrichaceae bacterium I46]ASU18013.1 signal peptidase I [[Clostridium] innocuum]MCR0301955.1 signal peptidase I [[Clostridium] innocuum]QQR26558.1 signal peptidase I [[Clostridium] innocuum]